MAKIEKNKLIEKVKELEGLSNDEKAALIGYIKTKTYGLVWEDSTEKVWEQLKDYIPVLTEDKSKAIVNDTTEQKNPNHILIEGDNLLALTNLCYTHEGKVDVIYIDPPYNTGNKDFVYYDDFCDEYRQIPYVDKEDSYRHSKWLSFMERRLKIARRLLSDKGVIFISIDDNEVSNLKLLCDEIFGERNFIDVFSWNKTETPANLSLKTKKAIEYILCYVKAPSQTKFRGLLKQSTSNNGLMNQTNAVHELIFPANVVDTNLANGVYPKGCYGTSSYKIELLEDTEVKDGFFIREVKLRGKFKWAQDYLMKAIKEGTQISIKTKAFSPSYEKAEYEPEVPWNLINKSFGVDTNETASNQLKEIIGESSFSYPKPVTLIKYIINFIDANTIMDFFAGSGTTLHATMQLNSEDGGHRQCILVQGIEKDDNKNNLEIAEKVTYERNKRVIEGYTKPNGEFVDGLKDNNLRYFKVGYVSREKDMTDIARFARQSVNSLCIKEDVYKEQTMFGELKVNGFRYFKDGNKQFLVILEPDMIEPIIEELTKMDYEGKMPVYVFTTGNYPYTEDFWEVNEKVDLYPYPTCVYGACEKVMPKMEDKLLDLPDDVELSDEEANMTYEDLNKE